MRKMTAAMAALGVVAGLGAAALPLSSYATSTNVQVTAKIDDALSITLTDADTADALGADGVLIQGVTPNGAAKTRTIAVTVGGSKDDQYKLTLEDRSTDAALINTTDSTKRIETGTKLSGATSAWGFVASDTRPTSDPSTGWKAVPGRGTTPAQLLGGTDNTGTLPTGGVATTYVTFGVYAATGQPSGTYTTEVVFTAAKIDS